MIIRTIYFLTFVQPFQPILSSVDTCRIVIYLTFDGWNSLHITFCLNRWLFRSVWCRCLLNITIHHLDPYVIFFFSHLSGGMSCVSTWFETHGMICLNQIICQVSLHYLNTAYKLQLFFFFFRGEGCYVKQKETKRLLWKVKLCCLSKEFWFRFCTHRYGSFWYVNLLKQLL